MSFLAECNTARLSFLAFSGIWLRAFTQESQISIDARVNIGDNLRREKNKGEKMQEIETKQGDTIQIAEGAFSDFTMVVATSKQVEFLKLTAEDLRKLAEAIESLRGKK